MTTVAFDGVSIAADTLITDSWGLINHTKDKIKIGVDFYAGFSGILSEIETYWKSIKLMSYQELIEYGYPEYHKDADGFQVILCAVDGRSWWLSGNSFMENDRGFHAIGSGRDFAIASMHLGKPAQDAVIIASHFDRSTNDKIIRYKIKDHPALTGK